MILCQRTSKGKGGNSNPTNLILPSCERQPWYPQLNSKGEPPPAQRAGMTELILNRTTPLSSSFTYFGDAKSASRLQWCNAESQLLSEPEWWEGKCAPEHHWMLPLPPPTAAPRLQGVMERQQNGGWAMEVDWKRWLFQYALDHRPISEAYVLRYLSFQLNCIKWKKNKNFCTRAKDHMPIYVHLDSKMVSLASACTYTSSDELILTHLYARM